MIHIKQHIPNFIDGVDPKNATLQSVADLDIIDWIRSWKESAGFHRFSQSADYGRYLLMAEYSGGAEWWVVGYLDQNIPGLPEWTKLTPSPG